MNPLVSLIIPCFNEEKYIAPLLDQILGQDYPSGRMEILVVDGKSSDRTREIVLQYAALHSSIRLLINERQYVPFALNMGIRNSRGELIFIIGAHASYAEDYISRLVRYSGELKADNVGGLCVSKPPDPSVKSLAISKAISHPFGVGNAHFRIGTKTVKRVDTVTFGCYPRSVFDRIGLFDEDLIRNQDDEFNARLVKNGGVIYLVPDVEVTYFTRNRISSILKMFYQYGLFKPLVSYKIGKPTTFRQLVPPAFFLFLILGIAGFFISKVAGVLFVTGLTVYLVAALYTSASVSISSGSGSLIFYLPWLFFCIHVAYGFGYLKGFFLFLVFRKRKSGITSSR